MVAKTPAKCPECGGKKVLPIVYGFPGPELMKDSERGKVVLGGCIVDDANPLWHCPKCDHSWGKGDQPRRA